MFLLKDFIVIYIMSLKGYLLLICHKYRYFRKKSNQTFFFIFIITTRNNMNTAANIEEFAYMLFKKWQL